MDVWIEVFSCVYLTRDSTSEVLFSFHVFIFDLIVSMPSDKISHPFGILLGSLQAISVVILGALLKDAG